MKNASNLVYDMRASSPMNTGLLRRVPALPEECKEPNMAHSEAEVDIFVPRINKSRKRPHFTDNFKRPTSLPWIHGKVHPSRN